MMERRIKFTINRDTFALKILNQNLHVIFSQQKNDIRNYNIKLIVFNYLKTSYSKLIQRRDIARICARD